MSPPSVKRGFSASPSILNFSENRFVYVAYSYRTGIFGVRNRLVRLREDRKTTKGVLNKVLLEDVAGSNNHDRGRVKFGPGGTLF